MTDPQKWISTLPTSNNNFDHDKYELDPNRWTGTLPKKNKTNSIKKYSMLTTMFVFGLILVSVIKNETRDIQKEIDKLKTSITMLKHDLHQASLDYEVISSPENISRLANEHLELELDYYKKSQIKNLDSEQENLAKIENKNKKKLSKEMQIIVKKKISKKMEELEKLQEIYSKPEKLPDEIKYQVAKKINKTKSDLKELYSDPAGSINTKRVQKWAAVQVVKAFLGIPVIPGR